MGVQGYLISARFLTTIGHVTTIFLLFSTIQNNIEISLGDGATAVQYAEAYQSSIAALILGIICFAIDFSGIFTGTSLFNHSVRFRGWFSFNILSAIAYLKTIDWMAVFYRFKNHSLEFMSSSIFLSNKGEFNSNTVPLRGRGVPVTPHNGELWIPGPLAHNCSHKYTSSNRRNFYAHENTPIEVHSVLNFWTSVYIPMIS